MLLVWSGEIILVGSGKGGSKVILPFRFMSLKVKLSYYPPPLIIPLFKHSIPHN